jgi:hypothetical protein
MIFKTGGRQPDLVTGGFDAFVFRHREATKNLVPRIESCRGENFALLPDHAKLPLPFSAARH